LKSPYDEAKLVGRLKVVRAEIASLRARDAFHHTLRPSERYGNPTMYPANTHPMVVSPTAWLPTLTITHPNPQPNAHDAAFRHRQLGFALSPPPPPS
jgi:hypothetical protein